MRTPLALALVAGLSLPSIAHACGGFFCNPAQPVDQKGEEILFALDEEEGKVEMHVKIEYEGPADEFAWILPAPSDPELAVGTDAVFPVLSTLRAAFSLQRDLGECAVAFSGGTYGSTASWGGSDGAVEVIRSGAVGPYLTTTLQASSSAALLTWLEENGYDMPPGLDALLGPYIADGSYFVALKLLKDKDAGDLEPLVLRFDGDMASIPIQLTSVAATPDMRLRVYVLGQHRAVPKSYLHVRLNHLAIDWWNNGVNLEDAITAAADEAGGHAFFTDYAGDTAGLRNQVFSTQWDTPDWSNIDDVTLLLQTVIDVNLPVDDNLLGVLSYHLGLPEQSAGTDIVDVLDCLSPGYDYGYSTNSGQDDCFAEELAAITYDPVALAADLEAVVLEPRRRVNSLIASYPKITRLTSSVSPTEMTLDPTFVFNPDMDDVSQTRFADEIWWCDPTGSLDEAHRELHLADGRVVPLPSMSDLDSMGLSEFGWLQRQGLTTPVAAVIERTDETGQPDTVVDNRPSMDASLNELFGDQDDVRGCGCTHSAPPTGWMAALPLAFLLRRR